MPETVFCLAPGPSLSASDVAAVTGRGIVIAIGDAYQIALQADVLYHTDVRWWLHRPEALTFAGRKVSIDHVTWDAARRARFSCVEILRHTGKDGIETDATGLRSGQNSGYAALNLAVHYRPRQIVLLGYDLQRDGTRKHFHGQTPPPLNLQSPYGQFLEAFQAAVAPLQALGIAVINCSRRTALRCFPCRPLEDVLLEAAA